MKHHHLLCAGLLLAAPLSADELIRHQPGVFFNQSEIKEIFQRLHVEKDEIILRDGTCFSGHILALPEVSFSFDAFPLNLEDVAAVAFSDVEGKIKVQMMTHDGYNFVTDLSSDQISFIPSMSEEKGIKGKKNIGIETISYILLHRDSYATQPKPSRLHILELSNGNQFPVLIAEENIGLSNGWEKFSIKPDDILNVNFDGGLFGTVRDDSGKEKELDFSFVTGRFLRLKVLYSSQTVGIPWTEVYAIRKQKIPTYETAEFLVKKEEKVLEQPLHVMRHKESDQLPEKIVWVEEQEPSVRFQKESGNVGSEAIVWIKDNAHYSENEQIVAMLQEEKSRLNTDWSVKQQAIQGQLTEAVEDGARLEGTIEKLEQENMRLRRETEAFAKSKKEFLRNQNDLVTNVEFEMTRSLELRKSLNHFYEMWRSAVEDLRKESDLSAQLQKKISFLTDSVEGERKSRESDALAFERQVANLSKEIHVKEEKVSDLEGTSSALKKNMQEKYREINQVCEAQKILHQELLAEIKKKNNQVDDRERELHRLNSKLAESEESFVGMEKNLKEKDEAIVLLTERLQKFVENNEAMTTNRDTLESLIQQLKEKLNQEEKESTRLNLVLMQKEQELIELGEAHALQVEALAQSIHSLTGKLSVGLKENSSLHEKTDELEKVNQDLNVFLTESQKLACSAGDEVNKLEKKLEEEKNHRRVLQTTLSQSQNEVQELRIHNQKLDGNFQEVLISLQEAQEELIDKNVQLEGLAKERENDLFLHQKLEDLENGWAQLSDELEQVSHERKMTAEQLEHLQKEYEEMAGKNSVLDEELGKLKLEIGNSAQEAEDLQVKLSRERHKKNEFQQKLDQLFPQYDREKEKREELQQKVASLNDYVKEIENALRASENREKSSQERYNLLLGEKRQLVKEKEGLTYQLRRERNRLNEQRDLAERLIQSLHSENARVDRMEKSQLEPVAEREGSRRVQFFVQEEIDEDSEMSTGSPLISFKGIHLVAEGENLNNISMNYYHTPNRWSDIYEANRDVISDVNFLQPGTPLVIPD